MSESFFQPLSEDITEFNSSTATQIKNSKTRIIDNNIASLTTELVDTDAMDESWKEVQRSSGNLISNASSFQVSSADAYADVAQAGVTAAGDAILRRLESLREQLLATRKIKIRALLDVTGAAAMSFPEIGKTVSGKAATLSNAKTLTQAAERVAGEIGREVISDPEVISAIAQLKEVQYVAKVLDSFQSMYNSVRNFALTWEFAWPLVDLGIDSAAAFMTGGVSCIRHPITAGKMAGAVISAGILPALALTFKNLVYEKEIEVPSILIGALESITTQEASDRFASAKASAASYLKADQASLDKFAASHALGGTSGILNSAEDLVYLNFAKDKLSIENRAILSSVLSEALINGTIKNSSSSATLLRPVEDKSYWADDRDAEKLPESRDPLGIAGLVKTSYTDADIVAFSKKIADVKKSSDAFFQDWALHREIVSALAEDGAIVDFEKETYDPLQTSYGGKGLRRSFTELNNIVTSCHDLLKGLTGEVRANIYEDVPVVDFYDVYNTGFDSTYLKPNFEYIERQTSDEIDDGIIHPDILNPPPHQLNLVLQGNQISEYFFNDRGPYSTASNLIVDYPRSATTLAADGPGVLNGRFSSVDIRSSYSGNPKTWKWYQETGNNADGDILSGEDGVLPLGTMYSPSHILSRTGVIIDEPLHTDTVNPNPSEYTSWGKATEVFLDVTTFMSSLRSPQLITTSNFINTPFTLDSIVNASDGKNVYIVKETTDAGKVVSYPEDAIIKTTTYETVRKSRDAISTLLHGGRKHYNKTIATDHFKVLRAKFPEKINNLSIFDLASWASLVQDVGGINTLVIDCDSNPIVRTVAHLPNPPSGSVDTAFKQIPSKYIQVREGGYYTQKRVIRRRNSSTNNYADELYSKKRVPLRFSSVDVILPTALFGTWDSNDPDIILYSKAENFYSQGSRYYLISKNRLNLTAAGTETATDKSLVSFIAPSPRPGSDGQVLSLQCTAFVEIPSFSQVQITKDSVTTLYNSSQITRTIWDPEVPLEGDAPLLINVLGTSCWVYELRNLVVDPDIQRWYLPLEYPRRNPPVNKNNLPWSVWSFIRKMSTVSPKSLSNRLAVVGIPEDTNLKALPGKTGYGGYGLSNLHTLFSEENAAKNVFGYVTELPVITRASGDLSLGDLLETLVKFQTPAATAFLDNLVNVQGYDDLLTFVTSTLPLWNQIVNALSPLQDSSNVSLREYQAIDAVLGNSSGTWLPAGDVAALENLVSYIHSWLEGGDEGTDPLRCLPNGDLEGNSESLYYKRYVALNARMNKISGPLSKAAQTVASWKVARKGIAARDDSVLSLQSIVKTSPVEKLDRLLYKAPTEESAKGKFYLASAIDDIQSAIDDKCLLVCAPCPVKETCPFYDEEGLIDKYAPEAQTIDLWLKDNQLDLLVYEEDDKLDIFEEKTGKRLDTTPIKNAHKPYLRLQEKSVNDEDSIFEGNSIENLRKDLSTTYPEFLESNESLDWLHGARYGTVKRTQNLKGDPAVNWLYDALYIKDEDTEFVYSESSEYKVSLPLKENGVDVNYSGKVRILEPKDLKLFENLGPASEVYLVSDDTMEDGSLPLIFLGPLYRLVYDFDYSDQEITSANDVRWPGGPDFAQWSVNLYKRFDPTPDKIWMPEVVKKVTADTKEDSILVLPGRQTVDTVVGVMYEKNLPSQDEMVRGKPVVKVYKNFIRKVRFSIDSIAWVKGEEKNREDIIAAQQKLVKMKTNIRLAVIPK